MPVILEELFRMKLAFNFPSRQPGKPFLVFEIKSV
jgi:hypothetical protein